MFDYLKNHCLPADGRLEGTVIPQAVPGCYTHRTLILVHSCLLCLIISWVPPSKSYILKAEEGFAIFCLLCSRFVFLLQNHSSSVCILETLIPLSLSSVHKICPWVVFRPRLITRFYHTSVTKLWNCCHWAVPSMFREGALWRNLFSQLLHLFCTQGRLPWLSPFVTLLKAFVLYYTWPVPSILFLYFAFQISIHSEKR